MKHMVAAPWPGQQLCPRSGDRLSCFHSCDRFTLSLPVQGSLSESSRTLPVPGSAELTSEQVQLGPASLRFAWQPVPEGFLYQQVQLETQVYSLWPCGMHNNKGAKHLQRHFMGFYLCSVQKWVFPGLSVNVACRHSCRACGDLCVLHSESACNFMSPVVPVSSSILCTFAGRCAPKENISAPPSLECINFENGQAVPPAVPSCCSSLRTNHIAHQRWWGKGGRNIFWHCHIPLSPFLQDLRVGRISVYLDRVVPAEIKKK